MATPKQTTVGEAQAVRTACIVYLVETDYDDATMLRFPPPMRGQDKLRLNDSGRDIVYNGHTYYGENVMLACEPIILTLEEPERVPYHASVFGKPLLEIILNSNGLVESTIEVCEADQLTDPNTNPVLTPLPYAKVGFLDEPSIQSNVVTSEITDVLTDLDKGIPKVKDDATQQADFPGDTGLKGVAQLEKGYKRPLWPRPKEAA